MPDSAERAVELLRTICPDAIQLHGEWTPDEIRFIRAETERKVLLAVDADDPARAEEFDRVADALVIDSTDDSGAGGTGETHDWERAGDLADRLTSPVVLAGGLTADNVAEAVRAADPFAVDVASGVELTDGRKDHNAGPASWRTRGGRWSWHDRVGDPIDRSKAEFVDLARPTPRSRPWSARPRRSTPT